MMSRERTALIFNPLTRQPWIGLEGESGGQGGVQPIQNQAEDTAPEQGITATPEAAEDKPEDKTEETPEPKTFTQEELDAAISKRLARERRKWERDQTPRESEKSAPAEPLTPDQFETYEAYAEALAEQIADKKVRQQELRRQHTEILSTFADREESVREKYDDYDQVARGDTHAVTDFMAEAVMASEVGPEIAYWLGQNPKESNRIATLPPLQQAREIGKIEAKLIADPPVKKTSSAPAPITPVNTHRSGTPTYDTTDPRSTKNMSVADWIRAENEREAKRRA